MIIVATDGGFNSLAQNQKLIGVHKKTENKGITLSALGIGKMKKASFLWKPW